MADIEGKDPLQRKVEVPFTVIAVIVAGVSGRYARGLAVTAAGARGGCAAVADHARSAGQRR